VTEKLAADVELFVGNPCGWWTFTPVSLHTAVRGFLMAGPKAARVEKLAEALIDEFKDYPGEIDMDAIARVVAEKYPEASTEELNLALMHAITRLQGEPS
jgi:hypothetical protein